MSPIGNETEFPFLGRLQTDKEGIVPVVSRGGRVFAIESAQNMDSSSSAFRQGTRGYESLARLIVENPHWQTSASDLGAEVELRPNLLPVLCSPGKIVALGRTFPAHAVELGNEPTKEPLVFNKLSENIVGDGDDLVIPWVQGERFDNEIELGILIGKPLHFASQEEAEQAFVGWCQVNDFTWRSEQGRAKAKGAPWFVAKNLPRCLPLGKRLVLASSEQDPRSWRFACTINGTQVQQGDFSGMGQEPGALVSWLSRQLPLHPGDLIALGTPKGVTSVKPGDMVTTAIENLGTLTHRIGAGSQQ